MTGTAITRNAATEAARVRLGAQGGTSASMLVSLATDPSPVVRAALALNPAAPARAERILARDPDNRVRALLARKLAALVPDLPDDEQGRLQHRAYGMLAELVEDEAVRVRAAIADVVKAMPDAPRHLILRLAHDCAVSVCEPVLRLSPLLEPGDLLALVSAPPSPATVLAIARRPDLNPCVADAIAAGTDDAAIRALLANSSAQIREATLDGLIARAADHADWHEPLVLRPQLSPRCARALASIVATHLLETLASRADLDPGCAAELRHRLEHRLADPTAAEAPRVQDDAASAEAMAEAHRLSQAGQINEASLLVAIDRGAHKLARAILSLAAFVPVTAVERAIMLRSPKGLVSLVWKAGFTMAASAPVQVALAQLPPRDVLPATPRGGFPLAEEEMRWQVDLLLRMGR